MKAAAFDYHSATSVAEAVALLAEGETRVLAGGQSLGPSMNLRLARPQRLVDVKRVAALRTVAMDDAVCSLGAGWTHAEIEDGAVPDFSQGMLAHIAHGIAYRAVRNRGTLGGSLAHADPAADWVNSVIALGGTLVADGPAGQRRIAAEDFMLGAFTTALSGDEVLVAVELPRLGPQARWGYHKLCRKTGEFAKAIGVAVHDPASGLARVLAGAVEAAPVPLPLTTQRLGEGGTAAALAALPEEAEARLAHLPPAERALRVVAVRRALESLAEG